MERVTEPDLPEVTDFLRARVEQAMFPLSNLANFGLDGDEPFAPAMWLRRDGGAVAGVLTITRNGTVLPACAPEDTLEVLAGRRLTRVIGPATLCRPVIAALDVPRATVAIDRDEPHHALDLADLTIPAGAGALRPLQNGGADEMIRWRVAYHREVLGTPPDRAAEEGRAEFESWVARGSHRVLMEGSTPLAVTGFNARLPGIVQIGGVFTPPGRRGRGHARRAVALHLEEARQDRVCRATLFAANAAARRAYESVGFRRIGDWTLYLLNEPARV